MTTIIGLYLSVPTGTWVELLEAGRAGVRLAVARWS